MSVFVASSLRFTFCFVFVCLLPNISLCASNESSIAILHPSGNNDSFVSASDFKQVNLLIKGFASAEKYLLRSTLHSDDTRANTLQWVEGFEWSFVVDFFVSYEQLEQVRSEPRCRRYVDDYPVK